MDPGDRVVSILNVLVRPDQLVVAVDTLAEDALSGRPSQGAKVLLIPQHNLVLATRGSAQFFLRIYELALQASFRADFTIEQLMSELGLVMDQLWPNFQKAVAEAGLPIERLGSEIILGGWSPKAGRMMVTAYAKSDSHTPAIVQPVTGQLASPGEPIHNIAPSMAQAGLLAAGKLQLAFLHQGRSGPAGSNRMLAAVLKQGQAVIHDLGPV